MKIGVITGSIRDNRFGDSVTRWVMNTAQVPEGVELVEIDLKSFDLPVFSGAMPPMMLGKKYDHAGVQGWSDAVDACDAYIFVTPEYNHGVPGGFKNAVDSIAPEWMDKAVAFIAYGYDGGVRAIEQWRQIMANFNMHAIRSALALSLVTEAADGAFAPSERRQGELQGLLDQLITAAR